ncbi:MAG: response regulator [Pseudomonadota bacterium]
MDDNDPLILTQTPTARRPLLGLTILVVEDSRYACETMRLMCLRSGARIRRADCLRSARRHLQVYRPSAVIVDMGLPDGSGVDLIEELANASPRVSGLLGISGDPENADMAINAGADGFLEKPLHSLAEFQQAVLAVMPMSRRPLGPRVIADTEINPDPMAYRDDMNHVASLLDDHQDGPVLDYVAQFLSGVARSARDTALADAARNLSVDRAKGQTPPEAVPALLEMVQDRITRKIAI